MCCKRKCFLDLPDGNLFYLLTLCSFPPDGGKLSSPPAFLFLGLRLVADKPAEFVLFSVEVFHGLMPFASACHFDKTEAFRLSGEIIHHEFCSDDIAIRAEQFVKFVFGNGIWKAADKKFHAFPPVVYDEQKLFCGIRRIVQSHEMAVTGKKMLNLLKIEFLI